MRWLKEELGKLGYQMDYATTFELLVLKLRELNISLEKHDKETGEIVARSLSLVYDWILWRCWSDKLLFEVKAVDKNTTEVSISAMPNVARIKVKKGEVRTNINGLLSRLQVLDRHSLRT